MRAGVRVPIGGLIAGALAGGAAVWYMRSRLREAGGTGHRNATQPDPELIVLPSPAPEGLRDALPAAASTGPFAKVTAVAKLCEELAASIAQRIIARVPDRLRGSEETRAPSE